MEKPNERKINMQKVKSGNLLSFNIYHVIFRLVLLVLQHVFWLSMKTIKTKRDNIIRLGALL